MLSFFSSFRVDVSGNQLPAKVMLCNMWCAVLWGHCGGGVTAVGLRGAVSAGRGQGGHCGCSHTSPLSLHYEVFWEIFTIENLLHNYFCIRVAAFICFVHDSQKNAITYEEQRHFIDPITWRPWILVMISIKKSDPKVGILFLLSIYQQLHTHSIWDSSGPPPSPNF